MTRTNIIKLTHLHRDRGYRFKNQDPVLEEISIMITRSGLSVEEIVSRIYAESKGSAHVCAGTINNWLNGKVKKPQNFTITWVAFALGYQRRWVKVLK